MEIYNTYSTQPIPIKVFKVITDVSNNQTLEFVDTVTNYRSYSFKRSLQGIGTFEIEINGDLTKSTVFQTDYVIQIGNDSNKQGQIKRRQLSLSAKNGKADNVVKVSGPQMKHILQGTLICPPAGTLLTVPNTFPTGVLFAYDGETGNNSDLSEVFDSPFSHQNYSSTSIANIIYDLVKKGRTNYVDGDNEYPVISAQRIYNLRIDTFADKGESDNTSVIDHSVRYKDLAQNMMELCELDEIGWNVYYDFTTNEWVFELIQGLDRTKNQSTNDWAVFSFNRGNIKSAKYNEDFTAYRGDVVVAGSQEAEERRMFYKQNTNNEIGINNKVTFRDARDVKKDDTEYNELDVMTARADEELEKNLFKQTLDIEGFVGKSTLVLDTDFTLGDFVSVEVEDWGLSGTSALNLQIHTITEKQMKNSIGELDLTFGKSENTVSSLLRKRMNKFELTVTN